MLRRLLTKAARVSAGVPGLREIALRYYENVDKQHAAWRRPHPIDDEYGTRTNGWIPGFVLDAGAKNAGVTAYAGSQPSVVRRGLELIENLPDTVLLDIGCGKGRALIVASEFPFAAIAGIELSASLGRIARKNAAIVHRMFPERTRIRVVVGDAAAFAFPRGSFAVFLYHPFGEDAMRRLVAHLERHAAEFDTPITIVYCNPVHGDLFDASPRFARAHALTIAVDPSERDFGPDPSETIVIWRDFRHASASPPPPRDALRAIVAVDPGWRAELAESTETAESTPS